MHPMIEGRDLIAQAQSGSGKTGAFLIGVYSKINPNQKHPQGVILANTHGLAAQIYDVASEIGKYTNVKLSLCVGSQEYSTENNLKDAKESHILICTPGRLIKLINLYPKLFKR
jgi:superfamily II DNA/RNA helicase